MENKLNPTFSLLACAILIWSASVGLSSYKAKSFEREHHAKQSNFELPAQITALQEEVKSNPENLELKLRLSHELTKYAFESSEPALLMKSLATLSEILSIDPKHPEALHDIAMLCFTQGIIDKAIIYFARYLEIRPDDIRAKTNYSIALIQAGNLEVAIAEIEAIEKIDNKYFPAKLAKILALKAQGEIDLARKVINDSKALSPDEEGLQHLAALEAGLDEKPADKASDISPAMAVDSYFRNHQIIGQKLDSIVWADSNTVHVIVKDFPVEQMPQFAKDKFLASISENFKVLAEQVKIEIRDAKSSKILIETTVGG